MSLLPRATLHSASEQEGCCGSLAGRLDSASGGSSESQWMTSGSQGPYSTGKVTAQLKENLLFFRGMMKR